MCGTATASCPSSPWQWRSSCWECARDPTQLRRAPTSGSTSPRRSSFRRPRLCQPGLPSHSLVTTCIPPTQRPVTSTGETILNSPSQVRPLERVGLTRMSGIELTCAWCDVQLVTAGCRRWSNLLQLPCTPPRQVRWRRDASPPDSGSAPHAPADDRQVIARPLLFDVRSPGPRPPCEGVGTEPMTHPTPHARRLVAPAIPWSAREPHIAPDARRT